MSVILENMALPTLAGHLRTNPDRLYFSLNRDFAASLDKPRGALTDLRQIPLTRSSVGAQRLPCQLVGPGML